MISCALTLRLAAVAASLLVSALPSAAKDIVGFVDQVTKQANPSLILILLNKETWTSNTIDTITGQLNAKKFKFDLQATIKETGHATSLGPSTGRATARCSAWARRWTATG
ncbi:hypothetical protein MesoLj113b_69790 (plasmid) [Mesorhizobium sp. 113-3-3]|nr:hypothetical protein MesoLj113b_69790 [Mesorhizobium sp. 113-3-3]